jgi:hypothetical protein
MPPIKIKITSDAESAEELSEKESIEAKHPQISLNARKTVDGKIMIMDHRDIDIVIDTALKKVITFPKNDMSDEVYQAQNNYFQYLSQKGIIDRASVQAGDVFASIQAKYPDAIDEGVSSAQIVLLSTYNFIEDERPRFETEEFYENEIDDWYAHPTSEDSTELGEVPEASRKGSINPASPYLRGSQTYASE